MSSSLHGSYSWLSASTLISGYASSDPVAVSVDGTLGTITLFTNTRLPVTLALTPCQGAAVQQLV